MKKILLLVIPFLIVSGAIGAWFVLIDNDSSTQTGSEKKTPHFESSTPASNMVLAGVPPNVTIDFNFDLAQGSAIEILGNGTDYGVGETTIDDNKLAMRRSMKQEAPDGSYLVKYTACWPDGSCHDGQFGFQVDRARASGYIDLRNQAEVTVKMSHIMFAPMELRISKGTKVTWVNDDEVEHFVNTDSHPAHTHVLAFNSRGLKKGDTFQFTFNEPGAYPYHCSAHASTMTGMITVE